MEEEASGGKKGGRRVYCCRRCGQPKKGHVCAVVTQEGDDEAEVPEARPPGQTTKQKKNAAIAAKRREEEKTAAGSNTLPDYFVVLDLEATCDDNWNRDFYPQEIIEFSAVLYNAETHEVEDSFQVYVKPVVHPVLTHFCKDLTGIHQEWVDNGVPLSECLTTFHEWLARHDLLPQTHDEVTLHKTFWLVTWSDWDLGTMLESQCLRIGLAKEAYFAQWVDIKQLYALYYSKKYRVKLADAVANMGLQWEGEEHCALDDCRNTSRLLGRIMDHGHPIVITSRNSQSLPP